MAFRIGRHCHPKARPEHPEPTLPATGIDYLRLVGAAHTDQLADRINYDALLSQPTQPAPQATTGDGQIPGQLDLTDLLDDHPGNDKPGNGRSRDGEEDQ